MPRAGTLSDVTVFERDAEGNLVAELAAPRADLAGRRLDAARRDPRRARRRARSITRTGWCGRGDLPPALLAAAIAHPRETPLSQLIAVIRAPGLGTQPGYRYMLWLQERLAAPLTTIAMILIIVALVRPTEGRAAQGWLLVSGVAVGFRLLGRSMAWC